MLSPALVDATDAAAQRMRVIWAALCGSVLLYVGVLYLIRQGPPESDAAAQVLVLSAYLQSLLVAGVSLAYRHWALSEARLRRTMDRLDGPELPGVDRTEGRLYRVLGHLQVVDVVGLALHESIALFGFVLAFLTVDPARILPFAALAIVANLLIFPRPRAMLEHARNLAQLPTSAG